jgi:hypothetical protein
VARQPLQERRPNAGRRHQFAQLAFVVDRGVDRRLRIGVRDVRKDAFGAAALIEIVVDECDAQRLIAASRRPWARTDQLI